MTTPWYESAHPLHVAAVSGRIGYITSLLVKGTSVNVKSKAGATALHYAAKHDNGNAIKVLVAAGATLDTQDNIGFTALHVAARYGSVEAVKALIEAGSALDIRCELGSTALRVSAMLGHLGVVIALVTAGASLFPLKVISYSDSYCLAVLLSPECRRLNFLARASRFRVLDVDYYDASASFLYPSLLERVCLEAESSADAATLRLVCKAWRLGVDGSLSVRPLEFFAPASL
jgi:hypothetical protein